MGGGNTFGRLWSREGLSRRDRSLATIGILINGLTEDEIAEVIYRQRRRRIADAKLGIEWRGADVRGCVGSDLRPVTTTAPPSPASIPSTARPVPPNSSPRFLTHLERRRLRSQYHFREDCWNNAGTDARLPSRQAPRFKGPSSSASCPPTSPTASLLRRPLMNPPERIPNVIRSWRTSPRRCSGSPTNWPTSASIARPH
ncbi:hypothetical protein MDOR_33260 [Mycolicibacterium doricum]|jgi:hypothetical protein|uniref:Uncharacterized protein n=1 Tax=Mycolicibacterium doricum TaxID=126673 RepID=A0A7I7VWD8_9MYCO|nr:hypothetical protein MDOR_33260 [Mycolicibacterium doricum]